MSIIKKIIICSICMIAVAIIFSCSKMNDSYSGYIKDGEIIYTGKVDSIKTYPGNNRIQLSMLLISDPKIRTVKVFWNDSRDSAVQAIQRSSGVDTVNFLLSPVAEGTYTFSIYTYDNAGHSSVRADMIGTVYGQSYINSLYNRALKSAIYNGASKATLIWYGPSAQTVGSQITYTDSLGAARNIFTPAKDTLTTLLNFKKGTSFNYRTLYKPVVNAIDTFYSNIESRQIQ